MPPPPSLPVFTQPPSFRVGGTVASDGGVLQRTQRQLHQRCYHCSGPQRAGSARCRLYSIAARTRHPALPRVSLPHAWRWCCKLEAYVCGWKGGGGKLVASVDGPVVVGSLRRCVMSGGWSAVVPHTPCIGTIGLNLRSCFYQSLLVYSVLSLLIITCCFLFLSVSQCAHKLIAQKISFASRGVGF